MKESWNELQFEILGNKYYVKDIDNLTTDHKKRFRDIIENYYQRIRRYSSNGCCSNRPYEYIKDHVDYETCETYLKELSKEHIDYVIYKVKELNPNME